MQAPIRLELPTPFGTTVNSWLFTEPEITLIDCGMPLPHELAVLEGELAKHGIKLEEVTRIILTHAHIDHFGPALEISKRNPDVVFECGPVAYDWISNFTEYTKLRAEFVKTEIRKSGCPEAVNEYEARSFEGILATTFPVPEARLHKLDPAQPVQLGGADWEMLYLPGHCQHQYGFYQAESGAFLSADALLQIVPVSLIDFEIGSWTQRVRALPLWLETIKPIYDLPITTVYPGHGPEMMDHRKVLDRQFRRIEKRKEQCYDLIAQGHETPYKVAEAMYANSRVGMNAMPISISQVYGYIDMLELEGRVRKEDGEESYLLTVINSQ